MNPLFDQPHVAVITHPACTRDAGSNAGSLNYTVPPATQISIKCMLQMRSGTRAILGEGGSYPIDAILYTTDERVVVDDLVESQSFTGMAGLKFVISSVMFKSDVDGNNRHQQCILTRSQKL